MITVSVLSICTITAYRLQVSTITAVHSIVIENNPLPIKESALLNFRHLTLHSFRSHIVNGMTTQSMKGTVGSETSMRRIVTFKNCTKRNINFTE